MRVAIVGADFEENLGVGMIAAVAAEAGHDVRVVPYNSPADRGRVSTLLAEDAPDLIGLSMQFQHRGHDFLSLARALRRQGYDGHITAGGQFASLAAEEVLARAHGVNSIVLHDGEDTFPELLAALEQDAPLDSIPGLAFSRDGQVVRGPGRGLDKDLDRFPFPRRYRTPSRHAGVPFFPIMGSRGCWGSCSYCSITSFYRQAKREGGGPTLRFRSPENVAREMAMLHHAVGEACVFCFHDDNFLLPRPEDSLARIEAICQHLEAQGVEKAGFIGKCRPETLTPPLARRLRELGVVRLYVGVENVAEAGARHLNRGTQHRAVAAALDACEAAGIFACYNLLIFEPEATIDDLQQNIAFMRAHANHPVNFCRAEPYYGTPLQLGLAREGQLGGSYLGWNYRIADDDTELAFRIASTVFRERNFRCDGVANRVMGVGYAAKLVEHFRPEVAERASHLRERGASLTRAITLDTARYLERVLEIVQSPRATPEDVDRVERQTALLGLEIAESDRLWQHELDEFYADVEVAARRARPAPARVTARKLANLRVQIALGATLALSSVGCGGDSKDDGYVADPLPQDSGVDSDADSMVADPVPFDAGMDVDPDSFVADPLPDDGGVDAEPDGFVADPPPPDAGMSLNETSPTRSRRLDLIDQWTETTARRAVRSRDLPLFDPPEIELAARERGGVVEVELRGAPPGATTRWEAAGHVRGDAQGARWTPDSAAGDALRVAVRSSGGVSFASLRLRDVKRDTSA